MRKTIISMALVSALGLAGCQSNSDGNYVPTPTQAPAPTVNSPTTDSEGSTPTPEVQTPDAPTTTAPKPEPTPSTTTQEAGTPATQFAQRWGKKYPQVPEFAILKAANRVCSAINTIGPEWISDPLGQKLMQEAINGLGISDNDAVEFAQDAQQNYCGSVSNPT